MRESYGSFILEQERKERKRKLTIIAIVTAVVLVIAVIAIVVLIKMDFKPFKNVSGTVSTEVEEVFYSQEELDAQVADAVAKAKVEASAEALTGLKQYLSEGMSTVEALRTMFRNELVIASEGRYHFIPIQDGLKKNNYTIENLQILENGEYQYLTDGQVTSYKGIDVSKFQSWIDWRAVAADGVQFAFIRVGNRGYETGEIVEDEYFGHNMNSANAAGVKTGVYFFSQAITEEEAIEEANFVLEKIAPYQVSCPVVLDVEMIAGDEGRADGLSVEDRTHLTKVFCETIANAGYKPMIYMNLEVAAAKLNLAELEAYEKWFAYYNTDFYYPYDYSVWQYSENGTVAGIKNTVDVNIAFKPLWE